MLQPSEHNYPHIFKNPISWAFGLSIFYWAYLLFSSQAIIVFDSISFRDSALLLKNNNWLEYFRTGPHKGPGYPFFISIAMKIAEMVSGNYLKIQTGFQVIILFVCQLQIYCLLKKLRIRSWIAALAILYFGFSPAIVNSAFSLFSEILTYPFILGIILTGLNLWRSIDESATKRIITDSLFLSLLFVLVTLTKATFEYIFLFILVLWIILTVTVFFKRKHKLSSKLLISLTVCTLAFYTCIFAFKYQNKIHNGQFVISDRGAWLVYGCATKRLQKLNVQTLMAGLVKNVGDRTCTSLFKNDYCEFWDFQKSDHFGVEKMDALKSQFATKKEVNSELLKLSIEKIKRSPIQYTITTLIESIKMFFWDSTRVGYVQYPPWLTNVFGFIPVVLGFRLFASLITCVTFFLSFIYLLKNRSQIFKKMNNDDPDLRILLLIFSITLPFIGLHSLVTPLIRYSFPIVPLYIIIAAICLNRFREQKTK